MLQNRQIEHFLPKNLTFFGGGGGGGGGELSFGVGNPRVSRPLYQSLTIL